MIMSLAGTLVNVPSSVIVFAMVTAGAAAASGMTYSGVVVAKAPGSAVVAAPLVMRASKSTVVGAVPPAGVSSDCGIATSTLSPSPENP